MQLADILGKPATGDHFLIREPRSDVAFIPDESGFWEHPDFRWGLVPADTGMNQYFADAGFELATVQRDIELTEMDKGCIGWTPQPMGDGWILVLVLDTEDYPQAVFARRWQ